MKPLPIKPVLSEDTRIGDIHLGSSVLVEMHSDPTGEPIYYIAEHGNPGNIYMVVDKELWNKIFE